MLARFVLSLSIFSLCHSAWADELTMADTPIDGKWLNTEQILETHLGSKQRGMLNRYMAGKPVMFLESHDRDMTTHYEEETYTMSGVWTARKDMICYYYNNRFATGEHCFHVYQSGTCFYFYSQYFDKNLGDRAFWHSVAFDMEEWPSCIAKMS